MLAFKDKFESFYKSLLEFQNTLTSRFEPTYLPFLDWDIHFGQKAAEIHHNSHTWYFCNYDEIIKELNSCEKPAYLGKMGRWRAFQNNNLLPNEILIGCSYRNGCILEAHKLMLIVDDYELFLAQEQLTLGF